MSDLSESNHNSHVEGNDSKWAELNLLVCKISTVEKLKEGRTVKIPDNQFKCYDLFTFSLSNNRLSDMNDSIRLDKSLDESINKSVDKAIDQYSLRDIRAGKPSPKKKVEKKFNFHSLC